MKVVAFNGSPRHDGNTSVLIKEIFSELEPEGIETELIDICGKPLRGCTACYDCVRNKNNRCSIDSDDLNIWIEKMIEADGIILGSPTYFADVTTEIKALIDRAGFVARANGDLFKRKIGAAVIAVRRGGAVHVFDTINHFFLISQMIVVGSRYWNLGIGRDPADVKKDLEGIGTMKILGNNMAWLLRHIVN
ncbi:flavodoxin family protein [bacterium]|nr:flavodoxin family protein [bacterium]